MLKIAQAQTDNERDETPPIHTKIAQARTETGRDENPTLTKMARATGEEPESRAASERSADETAEFGQIVAEVLSQQAQHNLDAAAALSRASSWSEIADVQRSFIAGSFERMNRIGESYRAMLQAGLRALPFPSRH